jgi:hypothetical protein
LTINDAINFLLFAISVFGIFAWAIRLRRWPLIYAAFVTLGLNIVFAVVKSAGLASPADLNLLSLVRVLLLTIVVAAIPFSVRKL